MRNKLHVSHRSIVPETQRHGRRYTNRRPRPSIHTQLQTTEKTTSNGNGPARSHPTNLPTPSPRFKSGKQMHGAFQNHERDIWTSSRGDQSRRDSTAWNIVDDQTVETLRTLLAVRAMRGILHVLVVAQSETKRVCVSGWRGFHDE